jgi:GNAT superfamily N-acetyltransferase
MLSIVPAVPEDAPVIHEIQMRAFAEEGRLSENLQIPPLTETVAAIDLHIRTQTVLTARDGHRIVGSARGIVDGDVCTIRGVSVEPSHQGKGIGGILLRAVEEANLDAERFELTTNTLVPGNVAFYERRGYKVVELTRYTDKIVLAQMSKPASARATDRTSKPSGQEFIVASVAAHREQLIELNVEYLSWVFAGLEQAFGAPADEVVGMSAREYVPGVIDKVCGDAPPRGVFYLVQVDDKLAGMGGLRYLRTGVAEIKRIYFRPEFRGKRLGQRMLDRLLADAGAFGFERVCLDTAPFMTSAHRLYEENGFSDCAAYEGVEVPSEFHGRWRFMERAL